MSNIPENTQVRFLEDSVPFGRDVNLQDYMKDFLVITGRIKTTDHHGFTQCWVDNHIAKLVPISDAFRKVEYDTTVTLPGLYPVVYITMNRTEIVPFYKSKHNPHSILDFLRLLRAGICVDISKPYIAADFYKDIFPKYPALWANDSVATLKGLLYSKQDISPTRKFVPGEHYEIFIVGVRQEPKHKDWIYVGRGDAASIGPKLNRFAEVVHYFVSGHSYFEYVPSMRRKVKIFPSSEYHMGLCERDVNQLLHEYPSDSGYRLKVQKWWRAWRTRKSAWLDGVPKNNIPHIGFWYPTLR